MKFNDLLQNHPSPVIAIDKNGFVVAKNYLAGLTFENLHVGAKISKYTDVDFTKCIMSRCVFYGNEYTYYVCNDAIDDIECYLMFISLAEYGIDFLPFDPVALYKEKVNKVTPEEVTSIVINKKRRYIRSIHNNLLRVNYFDNFKALFTSRAYIAPSEEIISLSSVCATLEKICDNYLSEADVTINKNDTSVFDSVKISSIIISSVLLNSLCFCIMNSCDSISVSLGTNINEAEILMEFDSRYDFFSLYKSDSDITNSDINSALSLSIASEICKRCGIDYKVSTETKNNNTHYRIAHTFKVACENRFVLSSQDKLFETMEKYILSIFFDEVD